MFKKRENLLPKDLLEYREKGDRGEFWVKNDPIKNNSVVWMHSPGLSSSSLAQLAYAALLRR